jgi:aspartyl protease family protein
MRASSASRPPSWTSRRSSRAPTAPYRAAPVELRELRIGQLQVFDLEASVNGGPLPISLLGMTFLQRLSSYEVAGGRLILRW